MSQIQVELQEVMGSDEAIANAAWTSTYDKTRRQEKYDDPKKIESIVQQCVKEGHSVPLESVSFRFWCRWPVFTDRQHMTHRMASHNGLSGRYRTLPSDFYEPPKDVVNIFNKCHKHAMPFQDAFNSKCSQLYLLYEMWLLELRNAEKNQMLTNDEFKRGREFLRSILPTAFMVERTTIMNLVSFANYQRLRNSPHAQPEIREGAQKMLSAVVAKKVAPIAVNALMAKGWLIGERNDEWSLWYEPTDA